MPKLIQKLEEDYQPKLKGLENQQNSAFSNLKKLGFPGPKHEEWKYSNVKELINKDFSTKTEDQANYSLSELKKHPLSKLNGIHLYFVNGQLVSENNDQNLPDGLKIINLLKAQDQEYINLENYFNKNIAHESEAFSALNTAFVKDGTVVMVSKNKIIAEPIFCHYVADVNVSDQISNLRNLLIFEENSQAKVIENFWSIGSKSSFTNAVSEIFVAQNANIDYYKIQNESDESSHIGTTQVYQEAKSVFYSATCSFNGGFIRNNLNILLDGEHIETHMFGLYLPTNEQHIDNHTLVDHRKPNCESNELYKGVLMDKSTGVFNGKIFVREDAQKTNAYQNCRNVITSDSATMNSKPQLEIWADDVKCSHGTTTGKLDDEVIFYLQTRGIPKNEAIRLQLLAFAEDVISNIKIEELREYLAEMAGEKLTNSL